MNKILIVEDNDALRKLLHLTFKERFEIYEAVNAEQAWEKICLVAPDVVVLDIMLDGEMDGYRLCEKIRAAPDHAGTHIVMVTSRGQSADREQGRISGADAYFVKPFSPLMLVEHVGRIIDGRPGRHIGEEATTTLGECHA